MARLVQHHARVTAEESRASESQRQSQLQSAQRKGRFSVARVRRRRRAHRDHASAVCHDEAGPDTLARPLLKHLPRPHVRRFCGGNGSMLDSDAVYFNATRNEWMPREDFAPPDVLVAPTCTHTQPPPPQFTTKTFDVGEGLQHCSTMPASRTAVATLEQRLKCIRAQPETTVYGGTACIALDAAAGSCSRSTNRCWPSGASAARHASTTSSSRS